MFIFLDEAGNFSGNKNECFIVGGFITYNPKRTKKVFRKWQHTKFLNKKLRFRTEIKFSDTRLTDALRLKTLAYFARQDIRVFYTFLRKKNIPLGFRKKQGLDVGYLYTEVVAKTLGLLLPSSDVVFRIFLDHRQLKGMTSFEFRKILRAKLLPSLPAKPLLQIEIMDSAINPNIQIADWICGALYRYYSTGKNGKEFFKALSNSIVKSEELFSDYWTKLYTSKKASQKR